MKNGQTWYFGLLAAAVLILLQLGRYSLWLRPDRTEWLLAGVAAGLLTLGYVLSRLLLRPQPTAGESLPTAQPTKPASAAPVGISEREADVLHLMAQGLSNREIADRLFIAESTVKTHVSSLFVKLNARRRTEAVRNAQRMGLRLSDERRNSG